MRTSPSARGGERGFASVGGGSSALGASLSGGGATLEKVSCATFAVEIERALNLELALADLELALSPAFGALEFQERVGFHLRASVEDAARRGFGLELSARFCLLRFQFRARCIGLGLFLFRFRILLRALGDQRLAVEFPSVQSLDHASHAIAVRALDEHVPHVRPSSHGHAHVLDAR